MHPKCGGRMEQENLLKILREEHHEYFHQEILKFFNDNKEFIEEQRFVKKF